ncbi:MAG: YqaA family protein [Alphaproteobacteria bacterium]
MATETAAPAKKKGIMKRLLDWVLHWAETPYAVPALFVLALAEASFFPIPPDALLIVLCLGMVSASFKYAAWCSVGSIIGGVAGYTIGYLAWNALGVPIINAYGYWNAVLGLADKYSEYGVWFLAAAGFTPIPYKVFTITTGAFDAIANNKELVGEFLDTALSSGKIAMEQVESARGYLGSMSKMGLPMFVLVSALSRSARFFLVATLLYFFGEKMRVFIEKYFNLLTIIFMVLLVLGFIVIKYVL